MLVEVRTKLGGEGGELLYHGVLVRGTTTTLDKKTTGVLFLFVIDCK